MHFARVLVTAFTVFFTIFSTVTAVTKNIIVGNKGRPEFDPENVRGLKAGDRVVFFYDPASKSPHVIFESTFDHPCSRKIGGYGPINATGNVYVVNNLDPVYFYSSTDDECAGGMKFAINAPKSDAFLSGMNVSTSTSTSKSNLIPMPTPAAMNSTSAGSYLRISIQRVTGLAGAALLVNVIPTCGLW